MMRQMLCSNTLGQTILYSLLVGMQNGAATWEDSSSVSYQTVFLITWSATTCLAVYPNELKTFLKINLCIYILFLAALGLRCCARAFSSCGERGLLFVAVRGLLIVVASRCGSRALGAWASVVVARGLSCSAACGIFLDHGLNPCLLHWQADS